MIPQATIPRHPFRRLVAAGIVACALAWTPATLAQDAGGDLALRRELATEQRLLREDVALYRRASSAEATARASLDEVLAAAEQRAAAAIEGGYGELRQVLADAEVSLAAAERRTGLALAAIRERLGRIASLGATLGAGPPPALPDLLSGAWQVSMDPPGLTGTFRLRQDATRLAGSYRLANGRAGSLNGTFVDGSVRLERVDSQSGFDAIFEAELSAPGRLVGTWRPTILGTGGPGGGAWTAIREPAAPAAEETTAGEPIDEEEVP
jgi:hypothetical protein